MFKIIAIATLFMSYPIELTGDSSEQPGHQWKIVRESADEPSYLTTHVNEHQCMITYDEIEFDDVYDVVKGAWQMPGNTFEYTTSYSTRVEAYSADGVRVEVRAHDTVVPDPTHDVCWIVLVDDETGAVTGWPRREVQWLLRAIKRSANQF